MKNMKKPLIFLAILLLLAGVAYWDEWQTKKDEKDKAQKSKLVQFDVNSIESIDYLKQVDSQGPLKIQLSREDAKWQIKTPLVYPADPDAVDRWLKTLSDISFEKSFEATADHLKDYGLQDPKMAITLKDKEGKVTQLKLGDKSPVGYSGYLMLKGDPKVYLVSQSLFTASNKELQDLRDKSLGLPNPLKIQGLSYQYGNESAVKLVRKDKDWQFESPSTAKADGAEVSSFLAFLERQRVDRFLDEPSPELRKALSDNQSGTKRLVSFAVETEDGKKLEYKLVDNNGVIYTQLPHSPSAYVALDKKIEEGLKKSARDFQFRGMFSFNSTEATKAEIDGKTYEKKGEQWLQDGGADSTDFIRLLLVDLEFAKAEQIITREEMAKVLSQKPLHSLKLHFKDGSMVDVAMWPNEGKPESIFLKRGEDGFFIAQAQLLDNFQQKIQPTEKAKIGVEG